MSERETPETDRRAMPFSLVQMHLPPDNHLLVHADFARKLERERDEAREHLKNVLERDSKFGGSGMPNDCGCIGLSRKAEREYEMGTCPHQLAREMLAKFQPPTGGPER